MHSLANQKLDSNLKNDLIKEAKKTIKAGVVLFLFDENQMIHQSTMHSQGSVFVNTASHTFIVNKKSSKELNNFSIGLHKAYEADDRIKISIYPEGTFMEIDYLG